MADFDRESMLEMFTYEMNQLLEQLEQNIIQGDSGFSTEQINEIFRIMHTIKGSAAMMLFDNISVTAHSIEDLFFYLREENPRNIDFPRLADHVLEGMDFIKVELGKIESGLPSDGDGTEIIKEIKQFLNEIKGVAAPAAGSADKKAAPSKAEPAKLEPMSPAKVNDASLHKYKAKIMFENGCEMENIRAYTLIHNMGDKVTDVSHIPEDVIDEEAVEVIRKNGFLIEFSSSMTYDEVNAMLSSTVYLSELVLDEITEQPKPEAPAPAVEIQQPVQAVQPPSPVQADNNVLIEPASVSDVSAAAQSKKAQPVQHVISVNVSKLDELLRLMGELVIAEAMVTQNPELDGLELESFHKEARQMNKIIDELQNTVMTMRMVPLSTTFFKMHRIVRDMCKQLSKDVELDIRGEETEVDKNIIEHISDPLMHIIRNSIDHGIELPEARRAAGKPEKGVVILEARESGGDVLIIIKDDGAGLNKEKIMAKAKANGLLRKPENEYTEKEINQFIFLPGFSTNDAVTAYSGRGVGMDVVSTNLEVVGGTVQVDSTPGEGSVFTMKIPLTLAIVKGMTITMGGARYTIPIIAIRSQFRAEKKDVFRDPDGNEMITVRGEVYNVVRLYEFFGVENAIQDITEGIMIMIENGDQTICLMADDLVGEQQVVFKTIPKYIKKVRGISGCTLLGNGDISLIINTTEFFDK